MGMQVFGLCLALFTAAENRLPSLVTEARLQEATGNYRSALDHWTTILAIAPEQPQFWSARSDLHDTLGNQDEAEEDCFAFDRLFPDELSALMDSMVILRTEGKLNEAEAGYIAAIKQYPRCGLLYLQLAHLLIQKKQFARVEELLSMSIRLNPHDNNSYLIRASLRIYKGNYDQAERDLNYFALWHPNHWRLHGERQNLEESKLRSKLKQESVAVKDRSLRDENSKKRWDVVLEETLPKVIPPDVEIIDERSMDFPLYLTDLQKKQTSTVQLMVSRDSGKTWMKAADAKPTDEVVPFQATSDGLHWMCIQRRMLDGKLMPETAKLQPQQKIWIKTTTANTTSKASDSSKPIALPPGMRPPRN